MLAFGSGRHLLICLATSCLRFLFLLGRNEDTKTVESLPEGLHGLLHEDKLQQIALSPLSIAEKVFAYIRLANEAGGHDNISAILLCTQESEVNK